MGSNVDTRYGGCRGIFAEVPGGAVVHAARVQDGGYAGHDRGRRRQLFWALDVRERLTARLALLAGMRPGEIFGLKWARMEADYADIRQRVYGGDNRLTKVGSIRTPRGSLRWVAHLHRLLAVQYR